MNSGRKWTRPVATSVATPAAEVRREAAGLRTAVSTWAAISTKGLAGLNAVLTRNGLQPIVEAAGLMAPDCGEKAGQSAAPTPRNR